MYRVVKLLLLSFALLLCVGCAASVVNQKISQSEIKSVKVLGKRSGRNIIISREVDLQGKRIEIPEGFTLVFKSGKISNGILVGNDTQISCKKRAFKRVSFEGSWKVPEINTSMFCDLNYENSLKDVLALCNPKIHNKVYIQEGLYYVRALKEGDECLIVTDDTELMIDGNILLIPNAYQTYNVVRVNGSNIIIGGKGAIVGDKENHIKKGGEWGMGIEIGKSDNVTISDITIKDCWGDCIYVGDESKKIKIQYCKLDNGRRQGISITSADHIWISDCVISNVSGTDPQYAIDIEPNKDKSCTNIFISNVRSENCYGGFVVSGIAKNSKIQSITFRNCSVSGAKNKYPMVLMKAEDVTVENCNVDSDSEYSMLIQETSSLKAHNNIFRAKGRKHLNRIYSTKLDIDNNEYIIKK